MEAQDIPIDINSGKLLDWLINRRHCNRDWQTNILVIREKINNAIQDMPVHEEIAKLLSGTHINYFHCKKIVEILKETEADTKNLFGRYGSQRMKDWLEIVRLYEKDNVYLGEAAQMLIRNVNYEVPGFKKQLQKSEQTQNDFEKKEAEYKKSENTALTDFNNLCKQLGISGKKIKKELMEKILELPDIYDRLAKKVKVLDNVVEFYNAFVEFTLGNHHDGGCVPMIKYIIDKGNTTTYEWTYGEPPLSITEPSFHFDSNDDEEDNDTQNDTIDFNCTVNQIDFNNLNLDGEHNFGDYNELDNGGEIDWGEIGEDPAPQPEIIDFEISLEESGIVVEDVGNDGGNASGSQALTILDNPQTRNDFINQLFELEAFLKLRLYEFKSNSNKSFINISHMQDSTVLQLSSIESIQSMLDNVQLILSEIVVDSKIQHLHNIKHSPRYVDLLVSNLKQKQKLIKKMEMLQESMREKQVEVRRQIINLRPILQLIIKNTKVLKSEIESDISKKYNGRKVLLTGGINTL